MNRIRKGVYFLIEVVVICILLVVFLKAWGMHDEEK